MVNYFYSGNYEADKVPDRDKPESGDEDNKLTALRLHAKMFALAHMYQVDDLESLAVAKYRNALGNQLVAIDDLLNSIPDVYELTPPSVRALRDQVILAVRTRLLSGTRPPSGFMNGPSGSEAPAGAADTLMVAYDELATSSPDFLRDLLDSFIRSPILATCRNCAPEHLQPAEVLQAKCLKCGKGGARLF